MPFTALIVEDEVLIRVYVCDILEEAGFDVLQAGSADEAWVIIQRTPVVAIVITDIEMPGSSNGLDLAWRLRTSRPDLPVLITSGRCLPQPRDLPPKSRFLAKPVAPTVLVEAVNALLSE